MSEIVIKEFDKLQDRYAKKQKPIKFSFRKFVRTNLNIKRSDVYTHNIHSYPGRLFPYIPIFFLSSDKFCPPEGKVLDPFSGSGTVLLESIVNPYFKRNVYGIEINPLGRLISKVKTTPIDPEELDKKIACLYRKIEKAKRNRRFKALIPKFKNIDLWFSKNAKNGLGSIKACIEQLDSDDCKDFFWVCFSKLVRSVSKADPNIPPPVILKVEKYKDSYRYEKLKKLAQRNEKPDVVKIFKEIIDENSHRIKRLWEIKELRDKTIGAKIIWDDSRNIKKGDYTFKGDLNRTESPKLNNSISMIITSPPYLAAQKYVRSTKLELYWLGMTTEPELGELQKQTIGTESVSLRNERKDVGIDSMDRFLKKIERMSKQRMLIAYEYFKNMSQFFVQGYQSLKKNLNVGISMDYILYRDLWEKLNKGISDEPIISSGISAARTIFLNELNLKILKAILMKLKHLQEIGIIGISNASEQNISSLIAKKINPLMTITTFTDLISILDIEIDKIKDYLQKITLPPCNAITPNWATTGSDFLDHASKIFIDNITALQNTKLYLLLDEFENLFPYQQVIINEWVKTFNNVVVKVGLKYEGMFTNMTLQGQPLQFKTGECDEITLDYDLFSDTDFAQYKKLFKKICATLLSLEGYKETDIENLLDIPSSPELPQETIDEYIKEIAGKRFREDKIKEFRSKLEIAAIFRLLRKKEKVEGRTSREKVYAGFDTYTYLSSGIIRVFLNLLGMAVYRAEGRGTSVRDGQKISEEDQSWAARIVSKGYLEKIHKNVEAYGGINGEVMYQFVTDIGDIFRERLLFHSSEPETLSISVKDPHNLAHKEWHLINNFFTHGVRESILYERKETSSYRPKQTTGIRTKDYVLNRVYTPALEISHRARWGRCRFSVKELSYLITADKREAVKKNLQERQRLTEKNPLFDKEEVTE